MSLERRHVQFCLQSSKPVLALVRPGMQTPPLMLNGFNRRGIVDL
jgi:hypothetical protein